MINNKLAYRIVLVLFLFAQLQFLTLLNLPSLTIPGTRLQFDPRSLSFINPLRIDSAGLSSASATLSNPRLSFYGGVSGSTTAGSQGITLLTTPNTYGDINTGNLFPNDTVAIGINGNIPVASISSSTVFTIKTPLPVTVANGAAIYATQSGTLTVDFYTSASLPNSGSIRIEIPAAAANYNDGAPDTASSIAANGFDLNGLAQANITCPAGPFGSPTVAASTGSNTPHVITCPVNGASIPAGAHFTIRIGDANKGLVNPAPINTGHSQGQADIYSIGIFTRDPGGNTLESVPVKTAPVEGVLVTATVDETLSFQVTGVTADSGSYCGITRDANSPDTTATAVPWNTINSDYTNNVTRHNTNQQLTITTNAPTGYTVYAEENDQMGKDGNACTGAAPSVEPYTFSGGGLCVRDYNKGAATWAVSSDWTAAPGTDYGFGYSLQNQSGTDAQFLYNESARAFSAKHFADQENTQSKYAANAHLMANAGPVSGSSVYLCYRLHVPAIQPAGYYYNKLKFTAVPKF